MEFLKTGKTRSMLVLPITPRMSSLLIFLRGQWKHCSGSACFNEDMYCSWTMMMNRCLSEPTETVAGDFKQDDVSDTPEMAAFKGGAETKTNADMAISKKGPLAPQAGRLFGRLEMPEMKYVNKEDKVVDILDIVKVMIRLRVMVDEEPVLGGRMQTMPVPFKNNMRFLSWVLRAHWQVALNEIGSCISAIAKPPVY